MDQPAETGVSEELLDEALEESFPASDPLSFWSGRDPHNGRRALEPGPGGDDRATGSGAGSGVGKGRGLRA